MNSSESKHMVFEDQSSFDDTPISILQSIIQRSFSLKFSLNLLKGFEPATSCVRNQDQGGYSEPNA